MPRPSTVERAKKYLTRFPDLRRAANDSQDSHNVFFEAALAAVKGFALNESEAFEVLADFASRSDSPWSEQEIRHKIYHAQRSPQETGYLRDKAGSATEGASEPAAPSPARPLPPPPAKPKFDLATLERVAGRCPQSVDLVWLANRSTLDPALVTPAKFLATLYKQPAERVLVFTNDKTQGEALWPKDELPTTGARGVWFLCQPVDGDEHPNPRSRKMSRRSEESVTDWRFLVLESDEAPLRLWLAALVQLPLRIAAIYTSGGRSVHALVKVDAPTKAAWDECKHAIKTGLVILGADPGAMSAVRLSRLPGCWREGRDTKGDGDRKVYQKFANPQLQKLLYLNPEAPQRPLAEMLPRRDVESDWQKLAAAGVGDTDETGGAWVRRGLEYYSNVSAKLKAALAAFSEANN